MFNNDYNETTIKKFGERIIISDISDQKIELYEFDKGDVEFITSVDYHDYTRVLLLYANKDELYFSASVNIGLTQHNQYLFSVNKNNGISYIKDFGDMRSIESMIGFNGKIVFQVNTFDEDAEPDGDYSTRIYDNGAAPLKTATSGVIELPIMKGKQVPAYIIARHKGLNSTATLTIKAKVNQTGNFNTISTNSDENSVCIETDIDSLGEVEYLQLQITLADSGAVNGIEDLEIFYLYKKQGLENSQK